MIMGPSLSSPRKFKTATIISLLFASGSVSSISGSNRLSKEELLYLRQTTLDRIVTNLVDTIPESNFNYDNSDSYFDSNINENNNKRKLDDEESYNQYPFTSKNTNNNQNSREKRAEPSKISSNLVNSLFQDDIGETIEHELIRTECEALSTDSTICKLDQFGYLQVVEHAGFKRTQQVLMKIENIETTSKLAEIVFFNLEGEKVIKPVELTWNSGTIADLIIPVEIFEQGSEILIRFEDINEGFDRTEAVTRVSYVKEKLVEVEEKRRNGHSPRNRQRRSSQKCDATKGCCRVPVGELKKSEIEEMALGVFRKNHRSQIRIVTNKVKIYTCYSKVAKCNLPTFANYNQNWNEDYEPIGSIFHNKRTTAGYGGCCQADNWETMPIVIQMGSDFKKFDIVTSPKSCSCGVKATTPTRRRRRDALN